MIRIWPNINSFINIKVLNAVLYGGNNIYILIKSKITANSQEILREIHALLVVILRKSQIKRRPGGEAQEDEVWHWQAEQGGGHKDEVKDRGKDPDC